MYINNEYMKTFGVGTEREFEDHTISMEHKDQVRCVLLRLKCFTSRITEILKHLLIIRINENTCDFSIILSHLQLFTIFFRDVQKQMV